MGIRMDQFMGLNEWARKLVEGEEVFVYTERVTRVYPDGRKEALPDRPVKERSIRKEESGEHYRGMFDNEYPLFKYAFPDGRVLREKVQSSPWSSGPVFFLALQDGEKEWVQQSLWTIEEIENA